MQYDDKLQQILQIQDEDGNTFLHLIAAAGSYTLFSEIIHLGISPNIINKKNNTVWKILCRGLKDSINKKDKKKEESYRKCLDLYLYQKSLSRSP